MKARPEWRNVMNLKHHQEQMEAARAEFNNLWHLKIIPRLKILRVEIKDFPKCEDVAWLAFIESRKVNSSKT